MNAQEQYVEALAVLVLVGMIILGAPGRANAEDGFQARAKEMIQVYATADVNRSKTGDPTGYAKSGIYYAMARYAAGDIEGGNTLADYIYHNHAAAAMFMVMGGMDLYIRYGHHMPQVTKDRFRAYISGRGFIGSGTENHKIMNTTGGYLAAQTWPDWNRAETVETETRQWIFEFIDKLAKKGMAEHDSPVYHVFYVNSLLSLYDHAKDPEMRRRAQIGLDLLMLEAAPEWLDGNWCASSLRAPTGYVRPEHGVLSGHTYWLYFGGRRQPPVTDGCAIMSAVSHYRVPGVIRLMATQRQTPYTHLESHVVFNQPDGFRKTTYMDANYGLWSHYDGDNRLGWSDQMLRWGLSWRSPHDGANFFITASERGETKEGQVLQFERTLIGIHKENFTGALPTGSVVQARKDDGNWIFIHGGSMLFGVHIIKPFSKADDTITSTEPINGYIFETAPVELFAGGSAEAELDRFIARIKSQGRIDASAMDHSPPVLTYTSIYGQTLKLMHHGARKVNGEAINYSKWPRWRNPWTDMPLNAGHLVVTAGDLRRSYDFDAWTMSDE